MARTMVSASATVTASAKSVAWTLRGDQMVQGNDKGPTRNRARRKPTLDPQLSRGQLVLI